MSEPALSVLIADDTPDICYLLRLTLEATGDFIVVGEAPDGAVAVEMARRHHPDAALIDLAMPVMDGLEAIAAIRAYSPATVIVAISGFSTGHMKAAAMAAGADEFVAKAEPLSALTRRLTELCAQPSPKPLDAR
jgi:CheY-like chemotaxis protein